VTLDKEIIGVDIWKELLLVSRCYKNNFF